MKVLVGIWHPAHVHFFRNTILNLQENGHEVQIVTRNKEMTLELLDAYNFEYISMGEHRKSTLSKGFNLLSMDYALYKIAKKFQPDVLTGIMDMYSAHVGKLINKPVVIFSDTEHGGLYNKLTFPFATKVCTSSCFDMDIGSKQIRYEGYHELAYLHPNNFTPNEKILDEIGLKKDDVFFILRFVSWDASHDSGEHGFNLKSKINLVEKLQEYGTVFITSETELPHNLETNRLSIKPNKIHDLLYYSSLYIGEGATMASEAAILGVPAIFVSSLRLGYLTELEKKYGLAFSFNNSTEALDKAIDILNTKEFKKEYNAKRERLLKDKIDVTSFMTSCITSFQ